MNVSAITDLAQRSQDFSTLQSSLKTGNLSQAQAAFAAFLQDVQKVSQPGSLFSPGSAASQDLQQLGAALKSANLSGAQKVFVTLQQDIQSAGQQTAKVSAARGHRPHTREEVASNGAELVTPTARSVVNILSTKV